MKYIIIIAIVTVLGATSWVKRVPEASKAIIQASIPVEFIDFKTPVVIEVSNKPDPTALFDDTSDGGITRP